MIKNKIIINEIILQIQKHYEYLFKILNKHNFFQSTKIDFAKNHIRD